MSYYSGDHPFSGREWRDSDDVYSDYSYGRDRFDAYSDQDDNWDYDSPVRAATPDSTSGWTDASEPANFGEVSEPPITTLVLFASLADAEENTADLARGLLSDIKHFHTDVNICDSVDVLGKDAGAVLLAGLRSHGRASRWKGFKAESAPGSDLLFDPFQLVVDTVLALPNLNSVELGFRITAKSYANLIQVLHHPKLEKLAITGPGFETDLLHFFLADVACILPDITLRHLSLAVPYVSAEDDLFQDVVALLRTGRAGGLEYLDLGGVNIFQVSDDHDRLVEEVEKPSCRTLLGLKLSKRDQAWRYGDRGLGDALKTNRQQKASTQRAASKVLPLLRALFQRPSISPFTAILPVRKASLQDLPTELVLEIVALVLKDVWSPLTARQLSNVIGFAADRETLRTGTREDFLRKVDYWLWDGVVAEEEEDGAAA